jgi:DNA-directed RNA polymerase subunit RPC12/RpoP
MSPKAANCASSRVTIAAQKRIHPPFCGSLFPPFYLQNPEADYSALTETSRTPRQGRLWRALNTPRGRTLHFISVTSPPVTSVPPTAEPFHNRRAGCRIHSAFHEAKLMFSLQGTEDGKFIYRCHSCGWEYELMGPDQVTEADQAIACSQTHKCAAEVSGSNTQAPKAS